MSALKRDFSSFLRRPKVGVPKFMVSLQGSDGRYEEGMNNCTKDPYHISLADLISHGLPVIEHLLPNLIWPIVILSSSYSYLSVSLGLLRVIGQERNCG